MPQRCGPLLYGWVLTNLGGSLSLLKFQKLKAESQSAYPPYPLPKVARSMNYGSIACIVKIPWHLFEGDWGQYRKRVWRMFR
jgi:hypothetical protein